MRISNRYLCALALTLLACQLAGAQTNPPAELNIALGEQRVRFAPTRSFQEMRLEVVNSLGETVFTHLTSEAEFDWNLRAGNSEALAPGLYRYTLSLKFAADQARQHTGHFIVEKGQDQVWLTASEGTEVSGTVLSASRTGGRSITGLGSQDDKSVKRDVSGREIVDEKGDKQAGLTKAVKAALLGTANMVPKYDVGGVNLIDSAITEVGGNVGIGITTPTSILEMVRPTVSDVVFKMQNATRAWSVGVSGTGDFWRIRDNTAGFARLAVTGGTGLTGGYVGIGTTAPAAKLDVLGDIRSSALRQELTASSPNVINGFMGTGSGGATPGNRVTAGVNGASIGGGGFNGSLMSPSGLFTPTGDNTNRVTDWFGTVGGGFYNRAGDDDGALDDALFATVGGGYTNIASDTSATVSGGNNNTASGQYATVGGGTSNTASNAGATVGGGNSNTASGFYATVGGGYDHTASGQYATVGGGIFNTASGDYSFAAGRRAKANHTGTFVWADSTSADFASTADNQFLIRAARVGIGINNPQESLSLYGNMHLGYNAGDSCIRNFDRSTIIAGTCSSDARYKRDIQAFPSMLARVSQLRPVNFFWRTAEFPDKSFGAGESFGLIAQEVEQLVPELVATNDDGYKAINYSKLPLVNLQAITELKAENDAIKAQNAALLKRLETVERFIVRMARKRK